MEDDREEQVKVYGTLRTSKYILNDVRRIQCWYYQLLDGQVQSIHFRRMDWLDVFGIQSEYYCENVKILVLSLVCLDRAVIAAPFKVMFLL